MPGIIETVSANCQDCYRCVRLCPVDAIRVRRGQAYVNGALCVHCGTCVRECPQGAKTIRSSLDAVQRMMQPGRAVVASVAPSFAAAYDGWRARRLPAALRMLGFTAVAETAEGARAVADATRARADDAGIPVECPAVVQSSDKYRPELIPLLIPVASPMVAHGRMLKARFGPETKVVAIGPCAAQKAEALRPDCRDAVDAVLTFEELNRWMEQAGVSLSTCAESDFETYGAPGDARLMSLSGGLLKAAQIEGGASLGASGAQDVMELLETPLSAWRYGLAELFFCRGGCVGGPCMPRDKNRFEAALDMAAYAQKALSLPGKLPDVPIEVAFTPAPIDALLFPVSEASVRQVLEDTGKGDPAQQLNCGACGYKTCRDYAVAVARSLAEPGMCASYARQKAERRANHIIQTSPNGIVVVDMNLNILQVNARFQSMFDCSASLIGQPVSRVVDPSGFEKLLSGASGVQEAIRTRGGMKYQERIFTLPAEHELTGIYVDMSGTTFDKKQVDLIKDQTLKHARDLLEHQVRFSQEMAHYLGKSTAQSEELVRGLIDMYAEDDRE